MSRSHLTHPAPPPPVEMGRAFLRSAAVRVCACAQDPGHGFRTVMGQEMLAGPVLRAVGRAISYFFPAGFFPWDDILCGQAAVLRRPRPSAA